MDEHNITRLRMNADMADSSNLVKTLIIRAEDARILGDMPAMKRYYRQLADMNRCAGACQSGTRLTPPHRCLTHHPPTPIFYPSCTFLLPSSGVIIRHAVLQTWGT